MTERLTNPALYESLFIGALRSTAFVLGPRQLKMFTKTMGEVIYQDLPERIGVSWAGGNDVVGNVKAFAAVEEKTGAYGADAVEVAEAEGGYDVTFRSCPYAVPCGELINELVASGKFEKKDVPCFRADVVTAVVADAAGRKARYEVKECTAGLKCSSHIELL